jgi:predicted dehydrogenase
VIGAGPWGREIAGELSRVSGAELRMVCDHYPGIFRRVQRDFPAVETVEDYRRVLDNPQVGAVFVATPSHCHREIAVAALEAGKHVYCEAPLATTLEDAKAIAKAAAAVEGRLIFQTGLQGRAEPQRRFVHTFMQSRVCGEMASVRSQWRRKESWRRMGPTAEREAELNWRLKPGSSPGLIGEIGIHHLDLATWFMGMRPRAVSGFGGITVWRDGREVPDTVHAVFEFSGGVHYDLSLSLGSSYEGPYDLFCGSESAILIADTRAWMFREADAPLLGWEVYARTEQFFRDTGISLMANATELAGDGVDLTTAEIEQETPLFCALDDFIDCVHEDLAPHAGHRQGFEAAVTAIKANEAVLSGSRIEYSNDWYDLS